MNPPPPPQHLTPERLGSSRRGKQPCLPEAAPPVHQPAPASAWQRGRESPTIVRHYSSPACNGFGPAPRPVTGCSNTASCGARSLSDAHGDGRLRDLTLRAALEPGPFKLIHSTSSLSASSRAAAVNGWSKASLLGITRAVNKVAGPPASPQPAPITELTHIQQPPGSPALTL
jgi:hypothetical protein